MIKRTNIEEKVARRLAEDPAFRSRLLADPRAALEAEFKIVLAPKTTVTLHEDSPTNLHLVLPPESACRSIVRPLHSDDRAPGNRVCQ